MHKPGLKTRNSQTELASQTFQNMKKGDEKSVSQRTGVSPAKPAKTKHVTAQWKSVEKYI